MNQIFAALIIVLLMAIANAACAPLWIAAGVELEHDEWCRTHLTDPHCQ